MTPLELKNSILQLAIQGKLVEQRPEEGTAAELLEKILAAKNAEGAKGKGEKFHAKSAKSAKVGSRVSREEIPDDEKPFDIPESWEWVRLGECSSYAEKKEKIIPSEIKPDDWSLDLEDIEKDTGRIIEFRSAKDRRIVGEKVVFHKGQILYSKLRPYLKKILVAPNDGICTPELVPFSALGGIDARYLVVVLKSPHVDFLINSVTYGVKMPRVGTETMINLPIPLPPLAEQKRIVAKIEELMPLVDRYEKAWSRLEDFNKRFPVDMQKSLLQMAIQGKLVEQRADEGTGAELLEKILAAKNAKDAEKGKGKGMLTRSRGDRGDAPSSAPSASPRDEIPDDEKPFDIPDSWEWVRLGELAQSIQYGYNASAKKNGRIKFVRISDIHDGDVLWDSVPYCDINENDIETYRLRTNDILFARTGGTVGKSYLVRTLPVDAVYAGYLIRARYGSGLSSEYIKYFMESPLYWKQLKIGTIATAQPNCNGKTLAKMLLPLPPLAEQKRIVAKIEELLPLCDRLK